MSLFTVEGPRLWGRSLNPPGDINSVNSHLTLLYWRLYALAPHRFPTAPLLCEWVSETSKWSRGELCVRVCKRCCVCLRCWFFIHEQQYVEITQGSYVTASRSTKTQPLAVSQGKQPRPDSALCHWEMWVNILCMSFKVKVCVTEMSDYVLIYCI